MKNSNALYFLTVSPFAYLTGWFLTDAAQGKPYGLEGLGASALGLVSVLLLWSLPTLKRAEP